MTMLFRFWGLLKYLVGSRSWGSPERRGFNSEEKTDTRAEASPEEHVASDERAPVADPRSDPIRQYRPRRCWRQTPTPRNKTPLRSSLLTWPCAFVLTLSWGCAGPSTTSTRTPLELTPESGPSDVRAATEYWLEHVALSSGQHSALPRSYPTEGGPIGRRHYLYDAALTLLWATQSGRDDRADLIARELISLQRDDGRWPDVITTDGSSTERSGSYPAGVTAWIAYALTYYDAHQQLPVARQSAERAARNLLQTRINGPGNCGPADPQPDRDRTDCSHRAPDRYGAVAPCVGTPRRGFITTSMRRSRVSG